MEAKNNMEFYFLDTPTKINEKINKELRFIRLHNTPLDKTQQAELVSAYCKSAFLSEDAALFGTLVRNLQNDFVPVNLSDIRIDHIFNEEQLHIFEQAAAVKNEELFSCFKYTNPDSFFMDFKLVSFIPIKKGQTVRLNIGRMLIERNIDCDVLDAAENLSNLVTLHIREVRNVMNERVYVSFEEMDEDYFVETKYITRIN